MKHVGRHDRDGDENRQCVEGRADRQRERHGERDGPRGVLDLLGRAGHLRQTAVGDEHEPDHRHDARHAGVEEGFEFTVATPHLGKSAEQEPRHGPEHEEDEGKLKGCAGLGSQDVHQREDGDQDQRGGGGRNVGDQLEVGAHAHEGERILQHQREPRPHSGDGADTGTERSFEEVVRPAGTGHGRAEFSDAQHRRHCHQPGDEVGDHRGRSALGCGEPGKQEETRAEHGPGAQGEHMPECEGSFEIASTRRHAAP